MKNLIIICISILAINLNAFANNVNPTTNSGICKNTSENIKEAFTTKEQLVFSDPENQILFIDLVNILDGAKQVEIIKETDVFFHTNTKNFNKNAILEITLNSILDGDYTINITSNLGIKYQSDLVVKSGRLIIK